MTRSILPLPFSRRVARAAAPCAPSALLLSAVLVLASCDDTQLPAAGGDDANAPARAHDSAAPAAKPDADATTPDSAVDSGQTSGSPSDATLAPAAARDGAVPSDAGLATSDPSLRGRICGDAGAATVRGGQLVSDGDDRVVSAQTGQLRGALVRQTLTLQGQARPYSSEARQC